MNQRGWLITAIVAVFLIVLSKSSVLGHVIIKFFVNNFANGRSDFKVLSFLVYLAVCSLIIFYVSNRSIKGGLIRIIKYKRLKHIFLGLLALTFLIGFASNVVFMEKFELDYFGNYKAMHNGRQSSTQIFHVHTFKAALSKLVDFINPDLHYYYDAGLFHATYLPSIFWVLGLICMPLLLMFSFFMLLQLALKRSNLMLMVYIVASFSAIKNSIDGGLVSLETIFWAGVLVSTILPFANLKDYVKRVVLFSGLGFYVVLIFQLLFIDRSLSLISEYISYLAFFLLLFLMFIAVSKRKFSWAAGVVVGYVILVLLVNMLFPTTHLAFTLNVMKQMNTAVPSNSIVYIHYPHTAAEKIVQCPNIIYSQDDFSICRLVTNQETKMLNLWEKYSVLPPNYKPVMVENVTCFPSARILESSEIIAINGTVPDTIDVGIMTVDFILVEDGKYPRYKQVVIASGCVPQYPDVSQRILNKFGISSYIVTN